MLTVSGRCLALIMLLSLSLLLQARENDFRVEIDAPDPLRDLLYRQLKIAKTVNKPELTRAYFRRLFREAPDQIRTILATEGYFNPEIKPSLTLAEKLLTARFALDPKRETKVASVHLEFVGEISSQAAIVTPGVARLRSQWSLPVGAPFKQADWEQAKAALLRSLLAERYPTATYVKTAATVNAQQDTADLDLVIDSGPTVTVGDLQISGLQRYDAGIVRNMNTIKPGEVYSLAKLQDLQQKLQNTLYFSYVAVTTDARRTQVERVPIHITVTEAQSKRLGLGVGVNTDTGVRAQVEINNLNFLKRGWRFNTVLRTETARQLLSGTLDFPLTPEGYRYGLSAASLRTTVQELDTTTLSIGGRRSIVAGEVEKSIGIEYLWEHVNNSGELQSDNLALYPSIVWSKRHFDNLLDPTRGYAVTLQMGAGLKSVLSKQDFFRLHGKWIRYFSPTATDQIILLAELGAVFAPSQEGIPNVLLYRSGGDQSIRGYAFQSLGLRRGNTVFGARYVTVGSLEYVHWLTPQWGAATFCDIGDAFDRPEDYQTNVGFGVGARWRSPVGAVIMDLAYGEASEQIRVHFALGIRF